MKASKIVSLLLVLVMCSAAVLTSCQKVTRKQVEQDPAGKNAEAIENTASSIGDSLTPVATPMNAVRDGGTMEITWKNDDIGIDLGGLISYDKDTGSFSGGLDAKFGDSSATFDLFGDNDGIAVASPELFDGVYGVDLNTVADDIRNSELFEELEVDADELADVIEKLLEEKDKKEDLRFEGVKTEFEKLKTKVFERINKIGHFVEKKDITTGGKTVNAIVTTFDFDQDDLYDVIEIIKDDSGDLFDEITDLIGDMDLGNSRFTDVDYSSDLEDLLDHDEFEDELDDILDSLDKSDFEGKFIISVDPKSAETLKVEFSLEAEEGSIEGEIDLGQKVEDFSEITGYLTYNEDHSDDVQDNKIEFTFKRSDDQSRFFESLEISYSEKNSSSSEYDDYKFSYSTDTDIDLSISFDHDKKAHTYELNGELDMDSSYKSDFNGEKDSDSSSESVSFKVAGALEYDQKSLIWGLDSVEVESDGEKVLSLEDFGLLVKISADTKLEKVPEFKNVFKLDGDELKHLAEEIEENAGGFEDDIEDVAENIERYFDLSDIAEKAAAFEP